MKPEESPEVRKSEGDYTPYHQTHIKRCLASVSSRLPFFWRGGCVSALPEAVDEESITALPVENGTFIIFAFHYFLLAHVLGTHLALSILLLRYGELQTVTSFRVRSDQDEHGYCQLIQHPTFLLLHRG